MSKPKAEDPAHFIRKNADLLLSELQKESRGSNQEKLEHLQRLSELLELRSKYRRFNRWRFVPPLLLIIVYVGVAIYAATPYSETAIQFDVVTSSVTFTLEQAVEIATSGLTITSLSFNQAEIHRPDLEGFEAPNVRSEKAKNNITFVVQDSQNDYVSGGKITFDNVVLPQKSLVKLYRQPSSKDFRLALFPPNDVVMQPLEADLIGSLEVSEKNVALNESAVVTADLTDSTSIDMSLAEEQIDTELLEFKMQVSSLGFEEVPVKDKLQGPLDVISGIQEGSLYLEDSEKTYTFRGGENLKLKIKEGFITSLELLPRGLTKVSFRGVVNSLKTGVPEHQLQLMPTRLEFWQTHQVIILLLGGLVYLLSFILSLFWNAQPIKGERFGG